MPSRTTRLASFFRAWLRIESASLLEEQRHQREQEDEGGDVEARHQPVAQAEQGGTGRDADDQQDHEQDETRRRDSVAEAMDPPATAYRPPPGAR